MMTQGQLPFQYQTEKNDKLTAFARLPLYIEMAMKSGLCSVINQKLKLKSQGWTDSDIILSLILPNLVGGDCVDDIDRLEMDDGLSTLLLKMETYGMKRKARREFEKRWRKDKDRALPSSASIHRYLQAFHNVNEEVHREEGKAFIPAQNAALQALANMNQIMVEFIQQENPCDVATLDQDATLVETAKRLALFCYKSFKAY